MRVGLVIYDSLDTPSGGYLYDRMLVEDLRRRGDDVRVISLPWRSYAQHLTDNVSAEVLQTLTRSGCDVMLQDELNHPSLVWTNVRLRRLVSTPLIGIVHHLRCSEDHPRALRWVYRHIERRYLKTLDGVILNSRTTKMTVARTLRSDLPGVVAYPGRDHMTSDLTLNEITRRSRESGPLRILFVGNLIRRKGLHILLRALESLPTDSWRLTVVGSLSMDRRYVHTMHVRITRFPAGHIVVKGPVPLAALSGLLAHHQVLCVPSLYEGFGIVYLEAMAFGEPVIATTAGAAQEFIRHGREGFLVPPNDPVSLAHYLGRCVRNRDLVAEMAAAAHRRCHELPTWADSGARIYEFLHQTTPPGAAG
jgi:glycosyltransferase involved in cell wall biosynthesis